MRYWEERARRYGARSVVNIGHSEQEMSAVTKMQRRILLPLLRQRQRGNERWLLDLGCGPGRFTADLAATTGSRILGIDPIESLLRLAPTGEHMAYARARAGSLPLAKASIDIVWSCLVLGGIVEATELEHTVHEIRRVLKPDGLLFLVENTSEKPNRDYWHFRGVESWRRLFGLPSLEHLTDYYDLGERISALCARVP